ncbi:conserved hypothetical protein [Candida tropicalis MYA-3404]|uniref:Uncharacterized protein n=1 Tax=Candida tropicalis (strain ATCC MYA-3404 / T1) TaxID=294747 RepID=C5MDN8_CANTT|nr:conserved hypothetical protein [Candida tropicalis MYA-3404]EER32119.1 conserved hypothetical protein [Candida tropicalis MYA-3404]KAG4405717.1 hypothetical protein JTP64_004588 [Candida tropicalis]
MNRIILLLSLLVPGSEPSPLQLSSLLLSTRLIPSSFKNQLQIQSSLPSSMDSFSNQPPSPTPTHQVASISLLSLNHQTQSSPPPSMVPLKLPSHIPTHQVVSISLLSLNHQTQSSPPPEYGSVSEPTTITYTNPPEWH